MGPKNSNKPTPTAVVHHLANPLALHSQGLHLGEVVVVGHNIGDDGLLIRVVHADICRGNDNMHDKSQTEMALTAPCFPNLQTSTEGLASAPLC
jgi:hypothetical protein